MNHPPKVRLLVTLGNVEVWVCEAKGLTPMLGPAVLNDAGDRVGQLVCFEQKPALCLGIRCGPAPTRYARFDPLEENREILVSFALEGGVVFPGGRDQAELIVTGYDEARRTMGIADRVNIELRRKGTPTPIWFGVWNSLQMGGPPELIWSDLP